MNKFRQVHNKNSKEYRKGKTRLKPLSVKTLNEMAEKESYGKKKDKILVEIARRS